MTETLGQPIAEGRTALIYAWKDGRILKLFHNWMPLQAVEYEARVASAVHAAGLPAPGQVERMDWNGQHGLLIERIEGPSMGDEIAVQPDRTAEYSRLLARVHATIHERSLDWLPSAVEGVKRAIQSTSDLPTEYYSAALSQLEAMPRAAALLHGDFHPLNVIMHRQQPVILDWVNSCQGSPAADVARTYLILRIGKLDPDHPFMRAIATRRSVLTTSYLDEYIRLTHLPLEEIQAWELPVAMGRWAERIENEREDLLQIIEQAYRKQISP